MNDLFNVICYILVKFVFHLFVSVILYTMIPEKPTRFENTIKILKHKKHDYMCPWASSSTGNCRYV